MAGKSEFLIASSPHALGLYFVVIGILFFPPALGVCDAGSVVLSRFQFIPPRSAA